MANIDDVTIKIKIVFNISLWQAIKLRIAGRNCTTLINKITEKIYSSLEDGKK